jgi:hypothetical protein
MSTLLQAMDDGKKSFLLLFVSYRAPVERHGFLWSVDDGSCDNAANNQGAVYANFVLKHVDLNDNHHPASIFVFDICTSDSSDMLGLRNNAG